jgi:predicted transcriptional regulator
MLNKLICEALMPRLSQHPKEESFNFRVDPTLKADFQRATEAADKPAAQVLRDFMRAYVERQRERAFAAEARRQSRVLAEHAADPSSDEAEVMRWIEDVSDTNGWTA